MEEESKYVQEMRRRFGKDDMSFSEEADFIFLINAPEAYQNEREMLEFVSNHPEAELNDVMEQFRAITPPGLPPGMTEEDLLDDEDD